ncbi:SAM-dependent methyltransferase [Nonomuraea purpurea]|uniref:SAM-dependent methyltransferase n=1 Tax=Nonomuraea purpurea TaxID=1849276 RepID=A0ABV8G361_9ACTN
MSKRNGAKPYIDTTTPNVARIYDYLLGGRNNFGPDRAAAEQIIKATPHVRESARDSRAFLRRAVTQLTAKAGIRQFIDIGTGLPSQGNVHEVAQAINPDARVAYIDNDPTVVIHARAMLARGEGAIAILDDLRDPESVLSHPALNVQIDLDRPVALLLVAVLDFIADDKDPYGIVSRLVSALAPGSFLVISHATADHLLLARADQAVQFYDTAFSRATLRSYMAVRRFFDGLRLVEPGLVDVRDWRPDEEWPGSTTRITAYGGIGQKPLLWEAASDA